MIAQRWETARSLLPDGAELEPCELGWKDGHKHFKSRAKTRKAIDEIGEATAAMVHDDSLQGPVVDADGLDVADLVRGLLKSMGVGFNEIKTPSGGSHFYTKGEGRFITESTNGWSESVDMRVPRQPHHKGKGLVLFAPGSACIDDDGNVMAEYKPIEWYPGGLLNQSGLDNLKSYLEGPGTATPATPGAPERTSTTAVSERPSGGRLVIPEGHRNSQIASAVGDDLRRGYSLEAAISRAQALNADACSPPLPSTEVETIARSIYRNPAGSEAADTMLGAEIAARLLQPSPVALVSAEAERTAHIPPRRWFVDTMLTVGFAVLTARKGIGKSMFALQLAYSIAGGNLFLGRVVSPGRVLYVVTELDRTAVHERLARFGPAPDELFIHYGWEQGDKGIEQAETAIKKHSIDVIIIDMMTGVLPLGADPNSYEMTPFFLKWRRMAHRNHAAVMGLWHSTKGTREDPMSNALGTTGLVGQADCFISLDRKRSSPETKLFVGGNHGRESTDNLWFDFPYWQTAMGSEPEAKDRPAPADEPIYNWLLEHGAHKSPDIAAIMGKKQNVVRAALARLKHKGLAAKKGYEWEAIVPDDENRTSARDRTAPHGILNPDGHLTARTAPPPLGGVRKSEEFEHTKDLGAHG